MQRNVQCRERFDKRSPRRLDPPECPPVKHKASKDGAKQTRGLRRKMLPEPPKLPFPRAEGEQPKGRHLRNPALTRTAVVPRTAGPTRTAGRIPAVGQEPQEFSIRPFRPILAAPAQQCKPGPMALDPGADRLCLRGCGLLRLALLDRLGGLAPLFAIRSFASGSTCCLRFTKCFAEEAANTTESFAVQRRLSVGVGRISCFHREHAWPRPCAAVIHLGRARAAAITRAANKASRSSRSAG